MLSMKCIKLFKLKYSIIHHNVDFFWNNHPEEGGKVVRNPLGMRALLCAAAFSFWFHSRSHHRVVAHRCIRAMVLDIEVTLSNEAATLVRRLDILGPPTNRKRKASFLSECNSCDTRRLHSAVMPANNLRWETLQALENSPKAKITFDPHWSDREVSSR